MEAIIMLACVVGLGALAVRYGADSREGLRSKEQALAAYGMRWEVNDRQEPGDDPAPAHRQHRINPWPCRDCGPGVRGRGCTQEGSDG